MTPNEFLSRLDPPGFLRSTSMNQAHGLLGAYVNQPKNRAVFDNLLNQGRSITTGGVTYSVEVCGMVRNRLKMLDPMEGKCN